MAQSVNATSVNFKVARIQRYDYESLIGSGSGCHAHIDVSPYINEINWAGNTNSYTCSTDPYFYWLQVPEPSVQTKIFFECYISGVYACLIWECNVFGERRDGVWWTADWWTYQCLRSCSRPNGTYQVCPFTAITCSPEVNSSQPQRFVERSPDDTDAVHC